MSIDILSKLYFSFSISALAFLIRLILADRQDWPVVIYESTLVTSGNETN